MKLLLPTDFSSQAQYAWALAQRIGQQVDIQTTFLHILPLPGGVPLDEAGIPNADDPQVQADLMALLAEAEAQLMAEAKAHPGATIKAVFGPLTDTICAEAVHGQYDLVVMGTKGASGLREWLSGSDTQHVVRRCPVPVLSMMCDRSDSPLQNLLLVGQFDDSEPHPLQALRGIQAAFGSRLHLLRILKSGENIETIRNQSVAFAVANQLTNYELHLHRDSGVEAGVVHFNQMHDMDLVCIGTHARQGIAAWLHGSVAEHLVNHLYKPMITYHLH